MVLAISPTPLTSQLTNWPCFVASLVPVASVLPVLHGVRSGGQTAVVLGADESEGNCGG